MNKGSRNFLARVIIIGLLISAVFFSAGKLLNKKTTNGNTLSVEDNLKKTAKEVLKSKTAQMISDQTQSLMDNVLGAATKIVNDAESSIIKSTVDKILQQLDRLPEKEKEEIMKEICK